MARQRRPAQATTGGGRTCGRGGGQVMTTVMTVPSGGGGGGGEVRIVDRGGSGTRWLTSGVDIDLPREDDPRRLAVRAWLEEHPQPSPAELVEAGFVVAHWPPPWGLDAEPELQLVIDDELKRAGVARPINPIGIGHCGPVIVVHGNDAQRERYLPPMLRGEELWCQLFSEPEAGSDLANLATRAVRDGDVFVVNGQKIWTSLGQAAKFGILIARTD